MSTPRRIEFLTEPKKTLQFLLVFSAGLGAAFLVFYVHYAFHVQGIVDYFDLPLGRDFLAFYTGSDLLAQGKLACIYDALCYAQALHARLGVHIGLYWAYPPIYLFFIQPLAYLSYAGALAAWVGITLILYVLACRAWLGKDWIWMALVIGAPATMTNFFLGQNGFLTGALWIGAFYFLQRRPVIAGILFGLLTFKPQLGLLIPVVLLAQRNWRVIMVATLTAAVFAAASLLVWGREVWDTYLHVSMPMQMHMMEGSLGQFTAMMPTLFMSLRILGVPADTAHSFQALLSIIMVLWTWRLLTRYKPQPALVVAWVGVATYLTAPYIYNYDMTLLTLSVLLILREAIKSSFFKGEAALILLIWYLPVGIRVMGAAEIPLSPAVLLAFLCIIAAHIRRAANNSAVVAAPS